MNVNFKYGSTIEGKNPAEGDVVFVNAALGADGDEKMGSIYKGDKIVGTTVADKLVISEDIKVAGLTSELAGIKNGDTIPAGTDVAKILMDMLSKTINPKAATPPTLTLKGNSSLGIKTVGEEVNIPAISYTTTAGSFNSDWTGNPTQPATGVTWSSVTITPGNPTGFTGYTASAGSSIAAGSGKVVIGSNTVTYTATGNYSAPTNSPVDNKGNAYTGADATFTAGSKSATAVSTTATGVYPIYSNLNGSTANGEATVKLLPTSASQTAFTFSNFGGDLVVEFQEGRNISSVKQNDLSGKLVTKDASTYTVEEESFDKNINGTNYKYKRFRTTGATLGAGTTIEITFSKAMNA